MVHDDESILNYFPRTYTSSFPFLYGSNLEMKCIDDGEKGVRDEKKIYYMGDN